jgi:hypothetical protein
MIPVVLGQLRRVTLKPVAVVRLNHPLEVARRVSKDITARLVYREVRRDRAFSEVVLVGRDVHMAEREETAVRIGGVVGVILAST